MADEIFEVEFIELELVDIEFVEQELVEINLTTIDVLPSLTSDGNGIELLVLNETQVNVSSLPSKRFRTANAFVTGKLIVYLNGMNIHSSEIIIHSDTEFSYPLDIISTDKVECTYIKKEIA